jgi:hypothetical protein
VAEYRTKNKRKAKQVMARWQYIGIETARLMKVWIIELVQFQESNEYSTWLGRDVEGTSRGCLEGQQKTVHTIISVYPDWVSRCARVPGSFRSDASLSTKTNRVEVAALSVSEFTLHLPFLQQASSCQLSQGISRILLQNSLQGNIHYVEWRCAPICVLFSLLVSSIHSSFILRQFCNNRMGGIKKILILKAPLSVENKEF